MSSKLRLAALVGLLVSAPALARTYGDAPSEPPPNPFATFRVSLLSGVPDVFGLSVSATMLRPFELEAGLSTAIVYSSWYARAGVALPLVDARGAGGLGLTVAVPVLAGYRYIEALPVGGTVDRRGGINAVAGVEVVFWLAPHFGLELQALGGGVYWLEGVSGSEWLLHPDVRLAAGIAF
jgi:hypothetical protein